MKKKLFVLFGLLIIGMFFSVGVQSAFADTTSMPWRWETGFCATEFDNVLNDVTINIEPNTEVCVFPPSSIWDQPVGRVYVGVYINGQYFRRTSETTDLPHCRTVSGSSVTIESSTLCTTEPVSSGTITYTASSSLPTSGGTFTDSGQNLPNISDRVALGDVDGDGDLDAVIAKNGVTPGSNPSGVLLNNGTGIFTDSGQDLWFYNTNVALGDLDGDGDLDAIFASYYYDRVWFNDGTGTFTESGQRLGSGGSTSDVGLGDLDGDGDLDAFFANVVPRANKVWFNDGNGTFTDSGQNLADSYSIDVSLGDLDGDGDLDAFVANGVISASKIWLNNGTGTFTDSGQNLGGLYLPHVSLGDLDRDGDLDAFLTERNGPEQVLLNDGSGFFTNSGQILGSSISEYIALGDIDGDGDLDAFIVGGIGAVPNKVWLNDGAGTFTDSGQNLGDAMSWGVALGDLDGDSDLDAFVANRLPSNKVWLNGTSVPVGPITPGTPTVIQDRSGNSSNIVNLDADPSDGGVGVSIGSRVEANGSAVFPYDDTATAEAVVTYPFTVNEAGTMYLNVSIGGIMGGYQLFDSRLNMEASINANGVPVAVYPGISRIINNRPLPNGYEQINDNRSIPYNAVPGVQYTLEVNQELSARASGSGSTGYGNFGGSTKLIVSDKPLTEYPVAEAGSDQTSSIGTTIELDGSASSDPGGSPLAYQWEQVGGEYVPLNNHDSTVSNFTASVPGLYRFELVVNNGELDSLPDYVNVLVENDVENPAIDIRKQEEGLDSRTINRGDDVTFEITVTNTGDVDLTNVIVSDVVIPACENLIGDLAVGDSFTYTCTAINVQESFTNIATVDGESSSGTPVTDEDPSAIEVIPEADLSITKSDDIDPVVAGDNLTYTIGVNNNGPEEAQNVIVSDILPAGVTFVYTTGCANDPNGVPSCDLGTIANGGSASYTVTVTVDSGTAGTIINSASVSSSTADPDTGNNSTSEDTIVNRPPVADDDSYSTNEDTVLNISAPGVLSNDSDADGDPLTAILDTGTSNGTLTLNGDGSFSYTPNINYCGPDSFTYHANDGQANSNIATVDIDVICIDDPPVVAVNTASQTVQYSDYISDVTITAADVDSASLSISDDAPSDLSTSGSCTPAGDGTNCIWTLGGKVMVAADTYDVT
ncbi:MAG: FG-GAP-like repeat-containing protein, partial [Candidatus Thorarchaeota archaeon]